MKSNLKGSRYLFFHSHHYSNSLTSICNLLHKRVKLERSIFYFFWAVNALHICLARCQINKGVKRPEVKQHTFPYCNHMSICRSLYTHSQHCFPSAAHLCHTWRETATACEGYSLSAGSLDRARVTEDLCTFRSVLFSAAWRQKKKGRLNVDDKLQMYFYYRPYYCCHTRRFKHLESFVS